MKLIKNNKKEKGFTLIELVVVIAILAILALILIPSLSGYRNKADTAKDEANARNIYTAATLVIDELEEAKQNDEGIKGKIRETNNELIKLTDAEWDRVEIDYTDKKITVIINDKKGGTATAKYPK